VGCTTWGFVVSNAVHQAATESVAVRRWAEELRMNLASEARGAAQVELRPVFERACTRLEADMQADQEGARTLSGA
jgi:hypothetical protein